MPRIIIIIIIIIIIHEYLYRIKSLSFIYKYLQIVFTSYQLLSTRSSHRDSFRKYLFFFSRSNLFIIFQVGPFVRRTDMNFPGGSICSLNRHEFSRRVYMFFEQTRIFQEGLSKRHVFSRRFYLFVEQTFLSHRTDTKFPRNPYLVLEHIRIFQEALSSPRTPTIFQETLSSSRTHTIFQEIPMLRTHTHFPGRYPLSNRYFVNRSRWLLSYQRMSC